MKCLLSNKSDLFISAKTWKSLCSVKWLKYKIAFAFEASHTHTDNLMTFLCPFQTLQYGRTTIQIGNPCLWMQGNVRPGRNTLCYHMNQWVCGALGLALYVCGCVCMHVVYYWCCVGIIGDAVWPQKSPSFSCTWREWEEYLSWLYFFLQDNGRLSKHFFFYFFAFFCNRPAKKMTPKDERRASVLAPGQVVLLLADFLMLLDAFRWYSSMAQCLQVHRTKRRQDEIPFECPCHGGG